MDSEEQEGELHPMPMMEGFGPEHQESSSMMKLLTSAMDEFPPIDTKVINNKEMKTRGVDGFPPLDVKVIRKETKTYRECVRNHCARAGGHAVDGCGEFMGGVTGESSDVLRCAACGCHRDFHVREVDFGVDSEAAHGEVLQAPLRLMGDSYGLNAFSKPKFGTSGIGTGMDEGRPFAARGQKASYYMACLRNHQASVGGLAVDGCQEFIAGGEEGTVRALTCGACECHRNFHRKEVEGEHCCDCSENQEKETGTSGVVPCTLSTAPTESDDQDGGSSAPAGARSKRFRTKFTQEQLEKMRSSAEKLGWKLQKQDELPAHAVCAGIGVTLRHFKVWMHNNKSKRSRE